MKKDQIRFSQRVLSGVLSALLATQPLFPAIAATITPAGNTQMDKAANGVPVVNIATPNASGISHNKYNDYNVGKEGLILNNATGQLNQTQLGGIIQNNPNLRSGKEATGIINEVTGSSRSQLQGYTEVAGKAANVMIANPYGITCNGCGFINTPNVTLTTGKPVLDANGNLQSLDVSKGSITIEGKGLDGSQGDAVSIIARATEINAALHAKDLSVIAGTNRVTAKGQVSQLQGEGEAPKVAVDTGALGGMYANRIRLVSSEKGLGVNLGNLNARQGDITLDANGKLTVKSSLASGAISMKGQDIALSGDHKAGGNVSVASQSDIALNESALVSDKTLLLTAQGKLEQKGGALTAGQDIVLTAGDIAQQRAAQMDAAGNVSLTGRNHVATQGTVTAGKQLNVNGDSLSNGGQWSAGDAARIQGGSVTNSGVMQGTSLDIAATRDVNLSGQLNAADTLTIKGQHISTATDAQMQSGKNIALQAGTVSLNGTHAAKNNLTVTANTLTHNGKSSATQMNLNVAQTTTQNGTLVADSLKLDSLHIANSGLLQGNAALNLQTDNLQNLSGGTIYSLAALALDIPYLTNDGIIATDGDLRLGGLQLINAGDIQADTLELQLRDAINNSGRLLAHQSAQLTAQALENNGMLVANTLTLDGNTIHNGGLVQGNDSALISAGTLTTETTGQWLTGNALTVNAGTVEHAGVMQGDTLTLTADALNNSGVLNGLRGLKGTLTGQLTNVGQIQSGGGLSLTANNLISAGRIVGDSLTLAATTLRNNGLWQGANGLTLRSDTLSTDTTSLTLSGGALTVDVDTLITQGTLQGQQVAVTSDDWRHEGALVSLGALTADISNRFTLPGELMSQGALSLAAQQLKNDGNILSESDITLNGQQFTNSGVVQGNTLTLSQDRIHNQGVLIGLQNLTVAAPQQELMNAAGGSLLTQGMLKVTSGDVTNAGTWQGQSILLNAQSLTNSGAIQSADALQLMLVKNFTSAEGSKVTALGNATLQALSLTNNGQWAASHLTLNGTTLDNAGAISGVNGLTLAMNGEVNQQVSGSMLTGGALDLNAASVANAGSIQGTTLSITSGVLTNSGRLQGDNDATLALNGELTNLAGGEIVSRQGLAIATPVMFNYGFIQSGGNTRINATTRALNEGKLLSGAELRLATPQYSGAGWLQATNLILNAATATNDGNWLADSATLTGSQFTNQGTTQAGQLTLNYQQLTNNGTVLGTSQLTVNAERVNQNAAGKLFSGGDLTLTSQSLEALGQVVALGNLTLKLVNAFTANSTLAAGNILTINSEGAIDNRNVMQGQTVNLTAGWQLSNNGQITTGSGTSSLSGSNVALNAAGTVQGGGDIMVTSHGNITVDGFTGTRGTLTLNTPGAIINTALLYAANNMALYADSITNQRGDILAGNSLWMQKDAAGNANREVINTSGTIETQSGDITIKTGYLLNQRDGLVVSKGNTEDLTQQYAWLNEGYADIPLSELTLGIDYGYVVSESCSGGGSPGHGAAPSCRDIATPRAMKNSPAKEIAISRSTLSVSANGGAGRISAARGMVIQADHLENNASTLLAGGDMSLSGSTLQNQSWTDGTITRYRTYVADQQGNRWETPAASVDADRYNSGPIHYIAQGNDREETSGGTAYRAVIQSGGTVLANFSQDISNTTTTPSAGGAINTLVTPTLNALSNQTIDAGVQKQTLADSEAVSVNSPQWNDQLQDALQQINGGTLDAGNVADTTLDTVSTDKNSQINQGKMVDTSAYPLPSGQHGYFVVSDDPQSPYLININPKLDGLGQLDPALFAELNALLGIMPGDAPRETNSAYTDQNQFLGSAYMLDRLNLNPEFDYRFLGDAAFDTRYVSNAMLNQTGSRYINGIGSDLDQMRYLMDSAAGAQQSLGLKFGVALTAEQIASLEQSMLWWEAATVNGETVMIPKLYLSPKDITVNNGSVISGNNVQLAGGTITNAGSTLLANNTLTLDSQNSINNLNNGLMQAGGNLDLSAIGDINNISAAISGKTVQLTSLDGSINNLTQVEQIDINAWDKYGNVSFKDTLLGTTASITAQDGLSLSAGTNITVTGATLSAGDSLQMNAAGDIAVNANHINDAQSHAGRWTDETSRSSQGWQGSSISAGGDLGINAGNNLNLTASDVNAGGSAVLTAGNDLNLNAASTRENSRDGGSESHRSGLDRTTISAGDNLVLIAGQDINAHAAGLAAENDVGLQAGRDVNLLAEATAEGDSYHAKKKTIINESVRQQGTEVASGGDTVIIAGRDVNAQATDVIAQGDIGVAAGRDVNLITATESDYHYEETTKTKKGFLNKKTTHTIEEDSATREKGALLSGDNVTVAAGNNILVQGSAVVGDGDVALGAGNNVDIIAATNTDTSWRFKETKKSGVMGTGGIGFSIGSSKTTHDLREQGTTQSESFSTVGSTGGNVSISAGQQVHIGGADIIAQKDIAMLGDSVVIEPGHDKRTRDETFEQKSSGLTVALSGAAGSAVNSAVQTSQDAKGESDDRLATLQATKTVLSGAQAVQAAAVARASDKADSGLGISVSLTSQSAKSEQHVQTDTVTGSTLSAGNNLIIAATGSGQSGNSGDILIGGSQIKAGGDTTLVAANDIVLSGAANTQQTTGTNSSSGGGVGVGIGVNADSYGISVFANVNGAKGSEKGNGTAWTETTLDSGGTVSLVSGRDAILNGAQVSGDRVVADIGGDLWMSSAQDSNDYRSKQSSAAAGGSFTYGSMSGSGYISASQDQMKSDYASVQEQTGLFAGDGGFDVTVGGHTQLDGAVIASTATADKNSLDTGTLGFRDIHNEADFTVSHAGAGMSAGTGDTGGGFKGNMPVGMVTVGGNSGHADGTTQAAVADGTITVRDAANQQQDVAGLSRDTEHANDSISPIFDKEKEQKRLQEVSLIGDIGSQAADIARTQGELNALEEARKVYPDKTVEELKETQTWRDAQAEYGTGSDFQRGIQAATAALQGLAGGDAGAALAGTSAPYLANIIGHDLGLSDEAALIAHAILCGAAAAMQGNSAAAGAAGAVSGELAAKAIMEAMYPGKRVSELSEAEKQTISMLASLSAGMAGALAGDSSSSAAAGAQAGKNAAENNLMGGSEDAQAAWIRQHGIDMASCSDNPGGAACQKAINERDAVGLALATGSVALLPGGAQAMWGLGAGANAGVSYLADGTIDPANAAIAGWVNVISMGNGLAGTIGWNAAGGALGNWIDDKDPITGAITNGIGAGIGYGIGKGISWGANAGANWWKGGWNPKFNPTLQKYTEVKGDFGISKEMTPSNFPSSIGDIGGSITSELGGKYTEQKMKQGEKK
ncbi:hemagglutinin repeat-containing protein [Citrobacter sp. Igbk 16]|uniref:hemagglutinin repeat-containing protein n=1 Tax=Citrobacter sp. Igbk 16 TaxID=2963958 RepID=UPI0023047F65|nr:hemagglutinin repeat-containing protein [Citrobacter sp. Igbk 16]MDA8517833.1 hemagglutinin repeat-containing protein [Citrobacter sp. Igbk 16]